MSLDLVPKGNYIGGKWEAVDHVNGSIFESVSPSMPDKTLGWFQNSSKEIVYKAVSAASTAFESWSRLSKIKRAEYLDHFAQLVKANTEEIAKAMAVESGKPIIECRADVIEGLHTAQYWFGRARMSQGDIIASEITEKESYVYRKPKGVVAAISPWNFPFAIPLWLICPSLMEGNTVVFKPSEETPLVAQILVDLFAQVGLPKGVLNLVQGSGEITGWELVNHPDVNVVLFTGSYEVGQKIRTVTSMSPTKFFAGEMGGKNAMILCEDADVDLAVNAAILSAFKTSGQRCVSASRIFVHKSIFDEFSTKFVEKAKHLVIGNASNEDTFMGPLINEQALNKVLFYNELAKEEGAKVLLDWAIPNLPSDCEDGYFITPFIYEIEDSGSKFWEKRVLQEEVFGPHVALIKFEVLDDVIQTYNACPYAFALSIFSSDYRTIKYLRENCDFGVGYVNLPTIGAEVQLIFGGLRKSGSGSPSASALAEAVTHRYSFTVNYGHDIKLAQGLK